MKVNLSAAATFTGDMPVERKAQIVEHLQDMGDFRRQKAIAMLIANGGPEADLARHLTGGAAPQDKQARAMQTK